MMSAAVFMVTHSRRDLSSIRLFKYYLGVGVLSIMTALIFTGIGSAFAGTVNAYVLKWIAMVLPVHFITLTGLQWPKFKPLVFTVSAIVLTPVFGAAFGSAQVIILPLTLGVIGVAGDTLLKKYG